jgi:hypothetical protein
MLFINEYKRFKSARGECLGGLRTLLLRVRSFAAHRRKCNQSEIPVKRRPGE